MFFLDTDFFAQSYSVKGPDNIHIALDGRVCSEKFHVEQAIPLPYKVGASFGNVL